MAHRTARNAETTRCTAAGSRGRFCDAPSIPDAPFPICVKHAAQVMRYLDSYLPKDSLSRLFIGVREIEHDRERRAPAIERQERVSVVYYLQVGQHIKIGRTENLPSRLGAYPPGTKVLAIEPGGPRVEQQRLHQFAEHLDARNEWFRPAPELLAHIAELRRNAA